MSVASRPSPVTTPDDQFYWAGLMRHAVLLQRCGECARIRFPAMPACPYCASPAATIVEASGGFKVYTWVIVRRAFDPVFADDVPYSVVTALLDEGCKMIGRFEGDPADLRDGLTLTPVFVDRDGWTELRFQTP